MSSLHRQTYYEVSLQRDDSSAEPISRAEWLDAVSADGELAGAELSEEERRMLGNLEAWKLESYPEGAPIFFVGARAFIREDDGRAIEKLVDLAKLLDASVKGEDGTEFFGFGREVFPGSINPAVKAASDRFSGRRVRIPLHEERIRKRQAAVVVVLGLLLPLYSGWLLLRGSNPGELYLWSAGSLALSVWAAVRFSLLRYFLEWNGGSTVTVYTMDTKSTNDRISARELAHSDLNPLELVWFPLEYPGKTVIERHVRSQRLSWLVFLASGNKRRCGDLLQEPGRQLLVPISDKSESEAAKNIPKKYQLSDEEKKRS